VRVRALEPGEGDWLRAALRERWAGEVVLGRGLARTPDDLEALVALDEDGTRVGFATYVVEGETAELVTIDALRRGAGVGSALLAAVKRVAREAGCARLLVMTTNDNLNALRFYQRAGFRLVALRPRAVDEVRLRKPAISLLGEHAIPIRDEIDLVLELG
jgi:GNAT superfamily N-acetyltransferase